VIERELIEATPSMTKKATSTMVKRNRAAQRRRQQQDADDDPSTAEIKAHQKPGACRIQKVEIRP